MKRSTLALTSVVAVFTLLSHTNALAALPALLAHDVRYLLSVC